MTIDLAAIEARHKEADGDMLCRDSTHDGIQASLDDIPALVAHIRTLEADAARLREALTEIADHEGGRNDDGVYVEWMQDVARDALAVAVLAQGGE